MPQNGIMTGIDTVIVITTPTGTFQPGGQTRFNARQMTASLDSTLINGDNEFAYIPKGWEIEIDLDRKDSVADDFFAYIEAQYYAGVDIGVSSITQFNTEANGAQTIYRFNRVVLSLPDAGSWAGDVKVTQKITGRASTRVKVQ